MLISRIGYQLKGMVPMQYTHTVSELRMTLCGPHVDKMCLTDQIRCIHVHVTRYHGILLMSATHVTITWHSHITKPSRPNGDLRNRCHCCQRGGGGGIP